MRANGLGFQAGTQNSRVNPSKRGLHPSERTSWLPPDIPLPRADHEAPFHFAMLLAVTVPALVKLLERVCDPAE